MKKLILITAGMLCIFAYISRAAAPPTPPSGFSLTLSRTNIALGNPVTVTWTAGTDASQFDWIVFYRANLTKYDFKETDYTFTTNSARAHTFTLPEIGSYIFAYYKAGTFDLLCPTVTARVSISGEDPSAPDGYTVSVSTNVVGVGEPFIVTYTHPKNADVTGDFVAVYPIDQGPSGYVSYVFVKKTGLTATAEFTIDKPGDYAVNYFDHKSVGQIFVDRASAANVKVVSVGRYSLTVDKAVVLPGNEVKASWESSPNLNIDRDAIVLYYKVSSYWYSYGFVEGRHSGTVSFTLPDSVGTYKIGYAKHFDKHGRDGFESPIPPVIVEVVGSFGDTYSVSVSTNRISVGQSVLASWTSPRDVSNRIDWVGLYKVGAQDWDWLQSEYVYFEGGESAFTINDPGEFEFRYYPDAGYVPAAVSERIIVNELPPDVGLIRNYPACSQSGTIVVFGDDMAFGSAGTTNDLASQLSRFIGASVLNRGVIGDTTETALARLDRDVLSLRPKIVVIFIGSNDLIDGVPRAEAATRLRQIVDRITTNGASVVLLGIEGQGLGDRLSLDYKIIAQESGAGYFPNALRGIVGVGNDQLSTDLIHPNAAGYALITDRIGPTVKALNAVCEVHPPPGPPIPPGGGGTNPLPLLTIEAGIGRAVVVSWPTIAGQMYGLKLGQLGSTNWLCVTNVLGDGGIVRIALPTLGNSGFVRLMDTPCSNN